MMYSKVLLLSAGFLRKYFYKVLTNGLKYTKNYHTYCSVYESNRAVYI